MSVEDIRGCFSVAPSLILLPNCSKLGKITLWRLLGSKWNLGMASNIFSSNFSHGLISVKDIGGCFSVAPLLILLLNYSKLGKIALWRLLRSKWNLGTASNILSSTLGQRLMSVEDIGGCFSVAPPLILLPNYSKLGKMTLWRLLRSKWNLGTASNILSSTLGQRLMSVEDIRGCFSVAPPLKSSLHWTPLISIHGYKYSYKCRVVWKQ